MKRYIRVYLTLFVTLLAGMFIAVNIRRAPVYMETDLVAINEIVNEAAENWMEPGKLGTLDFSYEFALFDNAGTLIYKTVTRLPDSVREALRQGFIPMEITARGIEAGLALIETAPINIRENERDRLVIIVLTAFISLLGFGALFLFFLHRSMIKPFKKLETFAHKIALGLLDEPLPMDKNNIFGLFTQSFDIMRESLLEARKQQARSEREKKELIASLNHDVKNPVTSIRLIAELLQARNPDPATAEKLKTIEIKADQIDRLMNDMLHSALYELGELKVTAESTDSSVLHKIFAETDHLSLIRTGPVPPCMIELDNVRMEQVIGNIVSNSYKYAGTNIDVHFSVQGELLQADINDYGPGVGMEETELITAKFYRGENARASKEGGEGLGLFIAKVMMDRMGGGLEAFNRKDGFTIRLLIRLSR